MTYQITEEQLQNFIISLSKQNTYWDLVDLYYENPEAKLLTDSEMDLWINTNYINSNTNQFLDCAKDIFEANYTMYLNEVSINLNIELKSLYDLPSFDKEI